MSWKKAKINNALTFQNNENKKLFSEAYLVRVSSIASVRTCDIS